MAKIIYSEGHAARVIGIILSFVQVFGLTWMAIAYAPIEPKICVILAATMAAVWVTSTVLTLTDD